MSGESPSAHHTWSGLKPAEVVIGEGSYSECNIVLGFLERDPGIITNLGESLAKAMAGRGTAVDPIYSRKVPRLAPLKKPRKEKGPRPFSDVAPS